MIMMDFPNAVTTRSAFYGRQDEFETASRTLLSGKRVPVVIIGERRIGKTSLLNVVSEVVCQQDQDYLPLKVQSRGKATLDALVEAILQQMSMLLKFGMHNTGLYDAAGKLHLNSPEQFDQAVQRVLPQDWAGKFLLCIDEFDEVVRLVANSGEAEKARLSALIHYLIEQSSLPITLFFTITRVPDPVKGEFPSPIITKTEIIELVPFSQEVSRGMIEWLVKDTKVELHPETVDRIIYFSGGHPYFIKLLVTNLTGADPIQQKVAIGQAEFERTVFPRALEDNRARIAIENIWFAKYFNEKHFDDWEKRVLLYLIERGEAADELEFRMAGQEVMRAVCSLLMRHYLVQQDGKYTIKVHFLEHWFRNWYMFAGELEDLKVHQIFGIGIGTEDEGV